MAKKDWKHAAIRIKSDVVSRNMEGEEVMLDLASGVYYGLNEVGSRIWSFIEKGSETESIVREIASEYGKDEKQIEKDLKDLVETLEKKGLIELV